MTFDITQIILGLIGLLAAVVTALVIPWIRGKVGEVRWQQLQQIVAVAVQAAEQMGAAGLLPEDLPRKLDYAMARAKETLARQGITFDEDTVRAAIEAAVLGLR